MSPLTRTPEAKYAARSPQSPGGAASMEGGGSSESQALPTAPVAAVTKPGPNPPYHALKATAARKTG